MLWIKEMTHRFSFICEHHLANTLEPDSSRSLSPLRSLLLNIEVVYRIKSISENIRRVCEYATDIAECVLNMTVEKTIRKE